HGLPADWSVGFYSRGTYMGAGHGNSAAASFNDARWGQKTAFFDTSMAGAAGLFDLGTSNGYAASGFNISESERVFFGVVMGRDEAATQLMGNEISSKGFAVGYMFKPAPDWGVSFTSAFLQEKNALLGSASSGYLRLAEKASSLSLGFSTNYDMGDGLQLGVDAMLASTRPNDNADSLITHTSRLTSSGFGVTLRKDNLSGAGDTFTASIKSPLRIISGNADLNVPVGTDGNGNPVFSRTKASLAPAGLETDISLGYTRPLAENTIASFAFELRRDADNTPGALDHAVMFRLRKTF
ncbi:MAG TPA: hypothetical protein VHB73_06835, partial [Alphaproteobacteria bacterium]|nr:hypothetical protein [Alphaproteobacteria bacterium]